MKVRLKKFYIFALLGAFALAGAVKITAQPAQLQEENPAEILVSYYDAINSKQFRRAYNYWKNPPQKYQDFVRGFNDTRRVRLITNPNFQVEGAAGSLYKEVPAVVISTMKNGAQKTFYGCYTLRKINLRPPDVAKEDTWHIDKGVLKSAPANSVASKLLADACGGGTSSDLPTGNNPDSSRVLGALGTDARSAEQAVSVPPNIRVNQDFEIAVTTNGNGCVSAADTGVVLGESEADVFVYDFTSANRPGIFCTMIFKTLPHKATLKFTKTGAATIRIWGRRQSGNSPFGEPIVITKRVTVR